MNADPAVVDRFVDEIPESRIGRELERRSQAVVPVELPTPTEIDSLMRLGAALSRALSSDRKPYATEVAVAKILLGRDLGLKPMQAMQGIHIFDGQASLHYTMLLGFLRARDGYDYRIVEHTREAATIEATDDDWRTIRATVRVTRADATAKKWDRSRNGVKENWTNMPDTMLLARAASTLVREHFPEVTNGMPVYVDDEVELRVAIGDGTGSGDAAGVELPQPVERLLADARAAGYSPLSNRGTVELAVGNRPADEVDRWLAVKRADLDAFLASQGAEDAPVDATVVDEPGAPENAAHDATEAAP